MQESQKQKYFWEFFSQRLKSISDFEHSQSKDDPHLMSKKSSFRGTFEKQDGKRTKTLLEFGREHLYHLYISLWGQLSFKKCLLGTCKILQFTADDKHSFPNKDNLMHPIQMHLSQEQKTFSPFSEEFLKSTLNFEHFQKKDDPHSWCISEVTYSKKRR